MRLALYQPDQAGNVGTILRTAACFGVPVDIIEPCGFPFSDRALKRAGMDYAAMAQVKRHPDWTAFEACVQARLILFTTAPDALPLWEARFEPTDTLLFGSESRGAPAEVHARAAMRVRIPQVEPDRTYSKSERPRFHSLDHCTNTRRYTHQIQTCSSAWCAV